MVEHTNKAWQTIYAFTQENQYIYVCYYETWVRKTGRDRGLLNWVNHYLLARIVRIVGSEYAKVREITTRIWNILRVTTLSFVTFCTSTKRKKKKNDITLDVCVCMFSFCYTMKIFCRCTINSRGNNTVVINMIR